MPNNTGMKTIIIKDLWSAGGIDDQSSFEYGNKETNE